MKARIKLMSDLRARLSKITELHGQALAEAVGQREPNSQEAQLLCKDLFLRFAGSDPTDGKSRTQWLVKTYIRDEQFKLEDLGRVDAALAAFERFKRKLPVEQREINHLKTLSALEALVDPFVKAEAKARLERDLSTATGREKRRLEEWKARDESIIVQEEKGLPTIAIPMTEFSSKWWGRGTQWCTAAENNNMFAKYHEDAPLVIIVCPDGAKFQMYVKSNKFQFMDNTDKTVDEKIIMERWSEFKSLIYWAVQYNEHILDYVPIEYRTSELCLLAVEQNRIAFQYVPKNQITKDLCRLAVQKDGEALYYIPANQLTPELCRMAVEQDGLALDYVHPNKRTPKLCQIAIEQNGMALKHVPDKKKTPELFRLAVKQNGYAIHYIYRSYKTPELCRLAVEQNGRALQYVPEEYGTHELYQLAIEQDGDALEFVPENEKTLDLCRLAVRQYGQALADVPTNYRTPELCLLAVQQNGLALKSVPGNKRTYELCRVAVEQNGRALADVPKNKRTPELLALIPTVGPKWNPDILQGLGHQYKPLQDKHQDDKELCSPVY
jgi:Domain of unknown function (DUF4116)